MDGARMASIAKSQPDLITAEAFDEMFKFQFAYVRKTMFIPGQVEQWITICDLNNMSLTSLPRKQIIGFGNICQQNLMFFLFRSFYTHAGWGQRALFKVLSAFIDPETKEKIVLDAGGAPVGLTSLFHPDQLETRFGGTQPTPTNFWPPYVGPVCIPPEDKDSRPDNVINPDAYERILKDNPEMFVHPLRMKPERCENAHFKLEEPEAKPHEVVEVREEEQDSANEYDLGSMASERHHNNIKKSMSFRENVASPVRGSSIVNGVEMEGKQRIGPKFTYVEGEDPDVKDGKTEAHAEVNQEEIGDQKKKTEIEEEIEGKKAVDEAKQSASKTVTFAADGNLEREGPLEKRNSPEV